jgi:hypothetical protein
MLTPLSMPLGQFRPFHDILIAKLRRPLKLVLTCNMQRCNKEDGSGSHYMIGNLYKEVGMLVDEGERDVDEKKKL